MLVRVVLLVGALLVSLPAVHAQQECSVDCSNAFVNDCIVFHGATPDPYLQCRGELDGGVGPLASVCVAGCTNTPAMAATQGSGANPEDNGEDVNDATEFPTEPTLCSPANQGRCECATTTGFETYTFWVQNSTVQRCFTVYTPDGATSDTPALLYMNGYAQDALNGIAMNPNSAFVQAADRYHFALLGLSSPDAAWTFGNNGVVNDDIPMPCSAEDNPVDIPYLDHVFDFVSSNFGKVYTQGFSQNSMFAAYAAFCYPHVTGVWQGGSGMGETGKLPYLPGFQAQCTETGFAEHQQDCITNDPCTDCQYWPIYPCSNPSPTIDCVMEYDNDATASGTGEYMYTHLVNEGHAGRLLIFSPTDDIDGGHANPQNLADWVTGCLGISEPCASECETSFAACVDAGTAAGGSPSESFASCLEDGLANNGFGALAGCVEGCSPTLNMLMKSEEPAVSLSDGVFGALAPGEVPRPETSLCEQLVEVGESNDTGDGDGEQAGCGENVMKAGPLVGVGYSIKASDICIPASMLE